MSRVATGQAAATATETNALTARERRRLETRERLFAAAVAEFGRTGTAAAEIGAVAEAVGVSRGTFYFHFPSKDHVLLELQRRLEDDVVAHMRTLGIDAENAAAAGAAPDMRAVFAVCAEGILRVVESIDNDDLVREIMALFVRGPSVPELASQPHPLVVELVAHLEAAADAGEIRSDVPALQLAALFLNGMFGFLITSADMSSELRVSIPVLIDVTMTGIGT